MTRHSYIYIEYIYIYIYIYWISFVFLLSRVFTFSYFVFKGRESRSCYRINFPSQSAIDFKKSFFFEPKCNFKKRNNNPNSATWNLTSLIWILSVQYLSEQTREFYIFTWQTSVFVRTPVSESNIKEVPWNQQKCS